MQTLSRTELLNKLLQGPRPILIEALPERYYRAGHLPGALNINHDAIKATAASALPDKDAEIVVYCANAACQNSDMAAVQLSALGYRKVAVFRGGKQDWQEAGLALVGA
ncbi:rhodanese-like domain-containing protein [Permianibacter sp. IMCC34836]|uniref:rhodanese-like domain-containing protein n=1 Tax=Permianibacter fluminis TaxID=2738515 RepID=UPI001557C20A|nr:rhodanese-like domain-containing protein [Permianibacter fluminis]NQD37611.1 rhodanese-like domain-containing protein [Permianibacter fluminis]